MAVGGDRRQHSSRIRNGGPIDYVLDVTSKEALDDRGILAHDGIEIGCDQLRVRMSGHAHKRLPKLARTLLSCSPRRCRPRGAFRRRRDRGPALGDFVSLKAPEHKAVKLHLFP